MVWSEGLVFYEEIWKRLLGGRCYIEVVELESLSWSLRHGVR
jgi:hypothetical protein